MTLDEAIILEDALEAIVEGCSREDFVAIHTPSYRAHAGFNYDTAQSAVQAHGTARKALNFAKSVIDSHR